MEAGKAPESFKSNILYWSTCIVAVISCIIVVFNQCFVYLGNKEPMDQYWTLLWVSVYLIIYICMSCYAIWCEVDIGFRLVNICSMHIFTDSLMTIIKYSMTDDYIMFWISMATFMLISISTLLHFRIVVKRYNKKNN